ncbi:MAG TPA: NADH-quinone oxidoreductase subunit N [Acidimicrobiia bacterium]|nr:NADH-quinone oxidoreductase subunit N [Acidimicrobiia bacterium]
MEIGDISFYGLFPLIAFTFLLCVMVMYKSLVRTNFAAHRFFGAYSTISISSVVILSQVVRWRHFDIKKLGEKDLTTLNGLVSTDRTSAISIIVICAIAIVASLVAVSYLRNREDIPAAEFYILLQSATIGMFAMVMANDFIAMFVALEVLSIPLYVLTALDRRRVRSLEGGFKYFIMGAASSAVFLYGIALHYGISGTTALVPPTETSSIAVVATVFILAGLLFKVAAVPFHFWSPDVYQGAPSPVTTFMSAITKLVAFVALVRIISGGAIDVSESGAAGRIVLTIACIASALFGSIVALRQSNIKRALAYSSISHTAYILLALKGDTTESLQAVITYVVIYAFVIAGTFAIVSVLSGPDEQNDSISSVNGLAKRNPWLAGSLTVLLLSQAGIPLTSGFIAKFDVFRVAFAQEFYITGLIVLIATVIAAAFYLRMVLAIYSNSFGEESQQQSAPAFEVSASTTIAIGICVVVTVMVGIFPALVTGFSHVL